MFVFHNEIKDKYGLAHTHLNKVQSKNKQTNKQTKRIVQVDYGDRAAKFVIKSRLEYKTASGCQWIVGADKFVSVSRFFIE